MNKVRLTIPSGMSYLGLLTNTTMVAPRKGMSYRDDQEETINSILSIPIGTPIFLDAPTGTGKSIIADAYARSYGGLPIVTATHTLQQQYEDLLGIPQLTGRGNWACLEEPKKTAADAWCTLGTNKREGCPSGDICPYFVQREQALQSAIYTCNYGHLPLSRGHILDEAHVYEDYLSDHLGYPFSLGTALGSANPLIRRAAQTPQEAVDAKLRKVVNTIVARGPKRGPTVNRVHEESKHQRMQDIQRYLTIHDLEKHYVLDTKGGEAKIYPKCTQDIGMARLFMSATLVDPFSFFHCDGVLVSVPSNFPPANRPFFRRPVGPIDQNHPQNRDKLVEEIDEIMISNMDSKGVVHSVSYDLTRYIVEHSKFKSLMITHYGAGDRDLAVERFKAAPPGRVLVSPAVTTGVDLPYDECRYQILAKMPFQYKDHPLAKTDAGKRYTAKTIVQSYGRGVRSKTDSCLTYMLDSNWDWFYRANRSLFPQWFREAII